MSTFFTRTLFSVSLLVAPLAVAAQTSPFDPTHSSAVVPSSQSQTAEALDPLMAPNQVKGGYRNYLRVRYAKDREALAVVHLFGRKRVWGYIWSVVGFSNTMRLAGGYEPTTTTAPNGVKTTTQPSPVGNIIFAGVGWGLGISRLVRYSNHALYYAMQQHDARMPFPEYVDNHVKDKDYDK